MPMPSIAKQTNCKKDKQEKTPQNQCHKNYEGNCTSHMQPLNKLEKTIQDLQFNRCVHIIKHASKTRGSLEPLFFQLLPYPAVSLQ